MSLTPPRRTSGSGVRYLDSTEHHSSPSGVQFRVRGSVDGFVWVLGLGLGVGRTVPTQPKGEVKGQELAVVPCGVQRDLVTSALSGHVSSPRPPSEST